MDKVSSTSTRIPKEYRVLVEQGNILSLLLLLTLLLSS